MTYKVDACTEIACDLNQLVLPWKIQDWLAQYQDNIIVWDIRLCFQRHGLPGGQHYDVAISAHCHMHPHVSVLQLI